MFKPVIACLTVVGVTLMVVSCAANDERSVIAERMKARLPAIQDLRTKCKIAEYATGYLGDLPEEAGPAPQLALEDRRLFEEENKDRKSLYALLAKECWTKEEKIGKLRAELMREQIGIGKIAADSTPGRVGDGPPFWVQVPAPDGALKWLHPPALPHDFIPGHPSPPPAAILVKDAFLPIDSRIPQKKNP